jgi:hypothetical protein
MRPERAGYAVSEIDHLIDVSTMEVVEDSFEGGKVAVNVGDGGDAHQKRFTLCVEQAHQL